MCYIYDNGVHDKFKKEMMVESSMRGAHDWIRLNIVDEHNITQDGEY